MSRIEQLEKENKELAKKVAIALYEIESGKYDKQIKAAVKRK